MDWTSAKISPEFFLKKRGIMDNAYTKKLNSKLNAYRIIEACITEEIVIPTDISSSFKRNEDVISHVYEFLENVQLCIKGMESEIPS